VQRDGYTEGTYRVKKASFEDPKEIVIKLRSQAVVAGRVFDREGQPLQSARIQAMRIAARVAGSWVAATGLLMLGWSLSRRG